MSLIIIINIYSLKWFNNVEQSQDLQRRFPVLGVLDLGAVEEPLHLADESAVQFVDVLLRYLRAALPRHVQRLTNLKHHSPPPEST